MGVAACRSSLPDVCHVDRGCGFDDQEVKQCGDDPVTASAVLSAEALYQQEILERKQWVEVGATAPPLPAASEMVADVPLVDLEALLEDELKEVDDKTYEGLFKQEPKEVQAVVSGRADHVEQEQQEQPLAAGVVETAPVSSQASKASAAAPAVSAAAAAAEAAATMKRAEGASAEEVAKAAAAAFKAETAPQHLEANVEKLVAPAGGVDASSQLKEPEKAIQPKAKPRPKKKLQPRQKAVARSSIDSASVASSTGKASSSAASSGGARKTKDPALDFSCPADKAEAEFERELKVLKKRVKDGKEGKAPANLLANMGEYNYCTSAGERDVKKMLFISFYREQYARIGTLDVSQYGEEEAASLGLSIKGGHRPMPKPKANTIDLPPDYKQPLHNISVEELAKYNCESQRMLICVHGDLFDVSDRPDKYGKDGPYWAMVGHDITWGLVCGNDDAVTYDQYFDIFKIEPREMVERKMQGLMSWWCFYEKEYGEPVGRLALYNEEWKLPQPPEVGDVCSVM